MITKVHYSILLMTALITFSAIAEEQVQPESTQQDTLEEKVKTHSEGILVNESISLQQARAKAQSRSEYGLEFRPRITEETARAALRIHLPSLWKK